MTLGTSRPKRSGRVDVPYPDACKSSLRKVETSAILVQFAIYPLLLLEKRSHKQTVMSNRRDKLKTHKHTHANSEAEFFFKKSLLWKEFLVT